MKKRILLVGQDQPLWQEIAQLDTPDSEWSPEFARTGSAALALIDRTEFDAVVSDIQLPDTEGTDLLDEVTRRRPNSLRVILSELADSKSTLRCIGKAHRHIYKPCDLATLLTALVQVRSIDTWVPSGAVQKLMPLMKWIPSPPSIYFQVSAEMQSPGASVERIGKLIGRDPAITAKVLQLANSAVFGLQLQVNQPEEAVAYIGLEMTRSLLLLAHTFSSFEKLQPSGFSVEALWRHSMMTGQFARMIATQEDAGAEVCEQAFAAGLLHDLGKLLFAANLPEKFGESLKRAREQKLSLWAAECGIMGACHAEVGACLLGIWGLPTPVVEAVALHHFPMQLPAQFFNPLTAVHVANIFEHHANPMNSATVPDEISADYLHKLNLQHRLESWRHHCKTPMGQVAA